MRFYTWSGTQEYRCRSEFFAGAHVMVHQKFNVSVEPIENDKFMQLLELSADWRAETINFDMRLCWGTLASAV